MQKTTFQRILVTGATGFIGCHLLPLLREISPNGIVALTRADGDLTDPEQVRRILRETRPEAVIHLAAKVGGIVANRKYPADFFHENIMLGAHMMQACCQAQVRKLVCFMGGCSYPAAAVSPIGEDQMWAGYPQPESASYSVAKKTLLVQSRAYRDQHGFNSIVLVPGNVYGEYDNFNFEYAHVIPAMIRRLVEAHEQGAATVTMYGSGRPIRDFVYAGDVARLIPWFLEHYDSSEPVNISSGQPTNIRDLAAMAAAAVGYRGELAWDDSMPDGQLEKLFDVARLRGLGLTCETPLTTGIRRTLTWFLEARRTGRVRL